MAERANHVRVPERRDDEAPASPEQLQAIRQLVAGMSLRGFRFDYRRLGSDQADAVIAQLQQQRDDNAGPASGPKTRGCVSQAIGTTVTLFVCLIVLLALAGGGYLIYTTSQAAPVGDDSAADDPNETRDAASTRAEPIGESDMFEGLGVDRSSLPERIAPQAFEDRPAEQPAAPDTGEPPPTPSGLPALSNEFKKLETLLVQFSQFTRRDYDQPIRAQSSAGMLQRLEELQALLNAIRQADAALADRIRAVVSGYAQETIDGQAIRNEIDAIRGQLDALRHP